MVVPLSAFFTAFMMVANALSSLLPALLSLPLFASTYSSETLAVFALGGSQPLHVDSHFDE